MMEINLGVPKARETNVLPRALLEAKESKTVTTAKLIGNRNLHGMS